MIYLYLDILFHNRKDIGVCRYCKRLYIKTSKRRSTEKYCLRIVPGKSKTCEQTGSKSDYENKAFEKVLRYKQRTINKRIDNYKGNDKRVERDLKNIIDKFNLISPQYQNGYLSKNEAIYFLNKYYYESEYPDKKKKSIRRNIEQYSVAYIESFDGYAIKNNNVAKYKLYLFYALNSKGQFRKLYAGIICNENYDVKKYWNNVFKQCKIKDVKLLFISNNPEIAETAKKKFPMADIQCNVSNLLYEKFDQLSKEKRQELCLDLKSLCTVNSVEQAIKNMKLFSRYWGEDFSKPLTAAWESIANIYKYSPCLRKQLALPILSGRVIKEFKFNMIYDSIKDLFNTFNSISRTAMVKNYTMVINNWNEISLELGIKK